MINKVTMQGNIDPKDLKTQDGNGQTNSSAYGENDTDDNQMQQGLTGETEDEGNVGGDLAGNACGNN